VKSEALLRIEAPHFVAGAIFENRDGEWKCIKAAPIIRYLCKTPSSEIKRYLDSKGWRYRWVSEYVRGIDILLDLQGEEDVKKNATNAARGFD